MGNATSGRTTCFLLAPQSEDFAKDVITAWGGAGVFALVLPCLLGAVVMALYFEEIYYIFLKSNSNQLKTSLLWILGIPSATCLIGTIGVFVPRAVVYTSFMYNLYVTFCVYKYYYLVMVFAGGTKSFVEKTSHVEIRSNLLPICFLACLPKIKNSSRTTDIIKWLIFQYVVFNPVLGALAMVMKADGNYYTTDAMGASTYISFFGGISTLVCMYGTKMLNTFAVVIEGMDKVHKISGKAICMQSVTFIVGFEGLIFNIIAQLGGFPCEEPLNFQSRRKIIYNYFVIPQMFLLAFISRRYFRRSQDIQRQVVLHDDLTQAVEAGDAPFCFDTLKECDRIVTRGSSVVYKSTVSNHSQAGLVENQIPGISPAVITTK